MDRRVGPIIASRRARGPILVIPAVRSTSTRGRSLYNRLADHRDSIIDVEHGSGSLAIADFEARYLTVDDIWIPLGESLLITKFRPVWNIAVDGFGNHDPGKGRYEGLRPLWDHLHEGRGWAVKCAARPEPIVELTTRIGDYLAAHPLDEED